MTLSNSGRPLPRSWCTRAPRIVLVALVLFAAGCHRMDPDSDEERRDRDRQEERRAESSGERPWAARVVELSPAAIERMGIRLAKPRTGTLATSVVAPAEVRADPDRVARVSPLVPGRIGAVHVTLGSRVTEGQPLATLRSTGLGEARAQLRQARSGVEVARANLKRQQTLRAEGIASERSLQEARLRLAAAEAARDAAHARLQVFGVAGGRGPSLDLTSPIAGVITQRDATQGETVGADAALFTVSDLSRVWVVGRVSARDVAGVATGASASLTLRAYPGRVWRGAISYVAYTLDEQTRTLPVRLELDNPEGLLRPGLFGTLRINTKTASKPVPIVPSSAVIDVHGRATVFVPGPAAHTFRSVAVVTGRSEAGEVEIIEGLAPEQEVVQEVVQQVVVQGVFVLKSQLLRDELGEDDDGE